jgi:hypothetical protein
MTVAALVTVFVAAVVAAGAAVAGMLVATAVAAASTVGATCVARAGAEVARVVLGWAPDWTAHPASTNPRIKTGNQTNNERPDRLAFIS